jgi:hypothetical protein
VKAAQASVAAANANTALRVTDGSGPEAAYPLMADNTHYTSAAYVTMARRIWTLIGPLG